MVRERLSNGVDRAIRIDLGDVSRAIRVDGDDAETEDGRQTRRGRVVRWCYWWIVNPTSGRGRGMKIWERRAAPTLRAAGAACETRVTTRAKEATEIVREADLMRYDGVVVVGGDGTVAEVFQGLRERGDEASTSTPLGVVRRVRETRCASRFNTREGSRAIR